ncbi:Glucose dehydrogenase [FAD, quinone] [Orchesella cincta]|uniref:Glucose dehydrogenase [FAD, quinone] n=1 Tax=Orchesella cincta TaxID=48709 RepID=A0A1D2NEG8_ORCCI|nr:Glucose dehydrogenase [FAD, quinone] [Orchesella cincta]
MSALAITPDLLLDPIKLLLNPFIQPIFVPVLYLVLDSFGWILSTWFNADRVQDEQRRVSLKPETYDFIVVGAGSAGSIVAARLSRNYRVLLLEAGSDPHPLQYIPGIGQFIYGFPEVDWLHKTVPQKFASLNSVNNQSSWTAGLGLGGSGNINLAIHLRGHKRDFDNWANITGDPSWSHEGVVPFFKAHEDYRGPGDEKYHGYNGDLRIEAPDYVGMGYDFVRAAEELGFKNVDLNGAPFTEGIREGGLAGLRVNWVNDSWAKSFMNYLGFDIIRFPIKRGVRQAPYKAFLEPALTRKTLTVRRYAHVNRILFKDGNTAYGIQYANNQLDRHGQKLVAFASKEVIITAGCMGTPKLLMLSGIGPAEHLNNLGIPVLADLPVGENLQDHLGVYLSYFTLEQPRSVLLERDLTVTQFSDWVFKGEGILTSPGCQATGVFSSSLAKARGEGDWPDLQFFFFGYAAFQNSPKHVSRLFNLKEDEITEYYKTSIGKDGAHIIVTGSRPYSRGYIRLGGSSPYDKIIIQPNYLADPDDTDFKALKEGVQKGLELMENTEAFRKLGARFNNVSLPGCQHLEFRSDPYWECFIRRFSVTLHHPGGTAAMGSVVTPELKVIGVQNLRVMDTSVEPQIPITNTQASTMMIAEKGSFLILEQWKDNNIVK